MDILVLLKVLMAVALVSLMYETLLMLGVLLVVIMELIVPMLVVVLLCARFGLARGCHGRPLFMFVVSLSSFKLYLCLFWSYLLLA